MLAQQRPAHAELTKRWSLPSQPPPTVSLNLGIPCILHHIYLPDLPAYFEATANQSKPTREEWGQSCALMHAPQGWWYVQWDQEAATWLITKHYAKYLKMWESVSSVVQRADMLKYFIMHAMGGLYLDLDIECWRPVDAWLEEGAEVVLQGTGAGVTNGVFAGVAGHAIWEAALQTVHAAWKRNPDVKGNELAGPPRMNEAFLSQGPVKREGQDDPWAGPHTANSTGSRNSTMVVHAARTWYLLCQRNEPECHQRVSLERAVGLASMVSSAGYHRYAASWLDGGNNAGIFTLDGLKTSVCRSCPCQHPGLAHTAHASSSCHAWELYQNAFVTNC